MKNRLERFYPYIPFVLFGIYSLLVHKNVDLEYGESGIKAGDTLKEFTNNKLKPPEYLDPPTVSFEG